MRLSPIPSSRRIFWDLRFSRWAYPFRLCAGIYALGRFKPITFAGLDNFWHLFEDRAFVAAFWNTIIYTVVSVPLTLACALGLAILLNQKIFGRDFFRTAMFFPYVASLVAVAVVWNMIFNPEMGPVNMLLYTLGLDPQNMRAGPQIAIGPWSQSSCSASGRAWVITW